MEAIILATSTWSVPDLPGQIPTALVPRAQSIAVRHGVVRRELAEHVSTNRGHARLTRQVDAATARPVAPASLDLRVCPPPPGHPWPPSRPPVPPPFLVSVSHFLGLGPGPGVGCVWA